MFLISRLLSGICWQLYGGMPQGPLPGYIRTIRVKIIDSSHKCKLPVGNYETKANADPHYLDHKCRVPEIKSLVQVWMLLVVSFFSQALFSHLLSSVHDCSDLSCCILHTHVHVCVSTYFLFHLIHSLAFITTHGYESSVNRELNWDRSEMVKGLKAVGA